tara:strand:+ start:126 stop:353 length:228 start_codon:yes stop_codon:yes gene_type:complete
MESNLEYDNKSNYYKNFFPVNFVNSIRAGKHNIVKITYENEITEYEYEYNSNGYPITSTEIRNGVVTEFSKYYYN